MREVLQWMLKMDLSGSQDASRMLIVCMRDAQRAVHVDPQVKQICATYCQNNMLTPRIEVMMCCMPDAHREMLIEKGPIPERVRNPSGYVMQLIKSVARDFEELQAEARAAAGETVPGGIREASP